MRPHLKRLISLYLYNIYIMYIARDCCITRIASTQRCEVGGFDSERKAKYAKRYTFCCYVKAQY